MWIALLVVPLCIVLWPRNFDAVFEKSDRPQGMFASSALTSFQPFVEEGTFISHRHGRGWLKDDKRLITTTTGNDDAAAVPCPSAPADKSDAPSPLESDKEPSAKGATGRGGGGLNLTEWCRDAEFARFFYPAFSGYRHPFHYFLLVETIFLFITVGGNAMTITTSRPRCVAGVVVQVVSSFVRSCLVIGLKPDNFLMERRLTDLTAVVETTMLSLQLADVLGLEWRVLHLIFEGLFVVIGSLASIFKVAKLLSNFVKDLYQRWLERRRLLLAAAVGHTTTETADVATAAVLVAPLLLATEGIANAEANNLHHRQRTASDMTLAEYQEWLRTKQFPRWLVEQSEAERQRLRQQVDEKTFWSGLTKRLDGDAAAGGLDVAGRDARGIVVARAASLGLSAEAIATESSASSEEDADFADDGRESNAPPSVPLVGTDRAPSTVNGTEQDDKGGQPRGGGGEGAASVVEHHRVASNPLHPRQAYAAPIRSGRRTAAGGHLTGDGTLIVTRDEQEAMMTHGAGMDAAASSKRGGQQGRSSPQRPFVMPDDYVARHLPSTAAEVDMTPHRHSRRAALDGGSFAEAIRDAPSFYRAPPADALVRKVLILPSTWKSSAETAQRVPGGYTEALTTVNDAASKESTLRLRHGAGRRVANAEPGDDDDGGGAVYRRLLPPHARQPATRAQVVASSGSDSGGTRAPSTPGLSSEGHSAESGAPHDDDDDDDDEEEGGTVLLAEPPPQPSWQHWPGVGALAQEDAGSGQWGDDRFDVEFGPFASQSRRALLAAAPNADAVLECWRKVPHLSQKGSATAAELARFNDPFYVPPLATALAAAFQDIPAGVPPPPQETRRRIQRKKKAKPAISGPPVRSSNGHRTSRGRSTDTKSDDL